MHIPFIRPTTGPTGQSPVIKVAASALATLEATIGARPAESGAILFADRAGVVRAAEFDAGSHATSVTYSPDLAFAKALDLELTRRHDLAFVGFAHSHPAGGTTPSGPDRAYAAQLMAFKKRTDLLLPILQTVPDTGHFAIHWWVARAGDAGAPAHVEPARMEVVSEPDESWLGRVRGSLDLGALRDARVIAAGIGGARSALEDLARCGVGQFVLLDPDVYEPTNLATQHVRRSEVGLGKAVVTAMALRDINPDAVVVALPLRVEDALAAAPGREQLLYGRLGGRAPSRTLLGAWTDSHPANAFVAHLGLVEGLPVVFADLFANATAGAVAFVAPGISTACHRCWVGRRYAHYEAGGDNPVTSVGAEIWATSRLNALKTRVTLLLLQSRYGGGTGRFATTEAGPADALVEALASRPIGVLKLRPEVEAATGLPVFRLFEERLEPHLRGAVQLDTTLWTPLTPKPGCPECGGLGGLAGRRDVGVA